MLSELGRSVPQVLGEDLLEEAPEVGRRHEVLARRAQGQKAFESTASIRTGTFAAAEASRDLHPRIGGQVR